MSSSRRLPLVVVLVILIGVAGVLGGCGGSAAPADRVTLQLNWFHEAEFVGYYVADAKGFYAANDLSVDIIEGGPGDPAREHVLDDRADFAISSFAEHKELIAGQRPAVAVMAAFQIPPLVIFSLTDSQIREPADLVGKRVGVTTDYWKNVLVETLKAADVERSSVKVVRVKVDDLEPLFDQKVDAFLGYAHDEPIHAEVAGHDVTNIFPADYGVGGYEGLVLTNERTVKERPDVVQGFVEASRQGWRYAVEHPDEAAEILLRWDSEPGLEFQKVAVRAVAPLVDTPQAAIGWIDAARWQRLMGAGYDPARPGYVMTPSASER
jgi:ABC-type nitrate/sulfonate/bicarbonate transport system substrate-binding protein